MYRDIRQDETLSLGQARERWQAFYSELVSWWDKYVDAEQISRSRIEGYDYNAALQDRYELTKKKIFDLLAFTTLQIADCLYYETKPTEMRAVILRLLENYGEAELESRFDELIKLQQTKIH